MLEESSDSLQADNTRTPTASTAATIRILVLLLTVIFILSIWGTVPLGVCRLIYGVRAGWDRRLRNADMLRRVLRSATITTAP